MVDLKVAKKKIVEKDVISSSDLPLDAQSLYLDIQNYWHDGMRHRAVGNEAPHLPPVNLLIFL